MRLQPSHEAPPFSISDIFGNPISLDAYKGKKVLLSFYRYASCPLCNLRMHQFIQQYHAYQAKGLHTIAFFQSPPEKILKYVTSRNDAPFPIVADPEHSVYTRYGVQGSWLGYVRGALSSEMRVVLREGFYANDPDGIQNLHPADFLIGPDQTIHTAFYGARIGDHIPFAQIESFLHA